MKPAPEFDACPKCGAEIVEVYRGRDGQQWGLCVVCQWQGPVSQPGEGPPSPPAKTLFEEPLDMGPE